MSAMTPQHPAAPEPETDANGRMSMGESIALQKAFDRDKWAGEWNSLPTAIDRLLADRAAAARERLRVVEGERNAAQAELRAESRRADKAVERANHYEGQFRVREQEPDQRARAESAEAAHEAEKAAHERLRAGVEALASPQWRRNRGHQFDTTSEAYAAGRNALVDDLRALLGGGEARCAMSGKKVCDCGTFDGGHPGDCAIFTPTPVPSEVAETTAGEREVCDRRGPGGECCRDHEPCPDFPSEPDAYRVSLDLTTGDITTTPARTPDEPDAGEVEALAKVLAAHRFQPTRSVDGTLGHGWCGCGESYDTKPIDEHEAHVATHLAALLDRVRREEGERVLREAAHAITSGEVSHEDLRLVGVDKIATLRWSEKSVIDAYDSGPVWHDWLIARAASVGRGEGL